MCFCANKSNNCCVLACCICYCVNQSYMYFYAYMLVIRENPSNFAYRLLMLKLIIEQ